jgi:hypothetical protein
MDYAHTYIWGSSRSSRLRFLYLGAALSLTVQLGVALVRLLISPNLTQVLAESDQHGCLSYFWTS